MTTLAATAGAPLATVNRRLIAASTFAVFGLVNIAAFGAFAHQGDAVFALSLPTASIHVPSIHAPAAATCYVLGAATLALAAWRVVADPSRRARRLSIAAVLLFFVISLFCWADAGNAIPVNTINLLQNTLTGSIPLILGALAGCMCERSGVINIAIEGQLLVGAFTAAIVSSVSGVWLGLVTGSLSGGLVGAVLAVFAIKYFTDQIILGVVLNVLALGLTNYLYDSILVSHEGLNAGNTVNVLKIPGLGSIPIIGPIFFSSNIFLYITYAAIVFVQIGLFSTRWGLRVRAVGEHPTAADTVGIRVLGIRYSNVIMGGLLAGIGGAYLTVGSVGTFNPGQSSGLGYIALAAMIFGRWTPLGATAAALLFGFSEAAGNILGSINTSIPTNILGMAPYVATIFAVAGLVGRVRAPGADGKPYIKA